MRPGKSRKSPGLFRCPKTHKFAPTTNMETRTVELSINLMCKKINTLLKN